MLELHEAQPPATAIGAAIRRREDWRLLTGHGCFIDDVQANGALHAVLVRSPHAHARIVGIDTARARGMPGVVAVFDASDLERDGVKPLPFAPLLKRRDGTPMPTANWPLLALEQVRHVGDGVAVVIAETLPQADDAAEAVELAYEPLPAVTDGRQAVVQGAPLVWEQAPDNRAAWFECGDAVAVEAVLGRASHVARVRAWNQRLVGNPLEPRGALCQYEAGRLTLRCTSQHSHLVRNHIADTVLRIPRENLRVVVGDLGGGFGTKAAVYPEYALVAWVALKLKRTVKWIARRSESFVSDAQGRDLFSEAELALDADGTFAALRVRSLANVGAYLSWLGAIVPTVAATRVIPGPYRIPAVHAQIDVVMSHTTPVEAYRGAGRPEYAFLLERLVMEAARVTGIDASALRERNLVRGTDMPFTTALGDVYDSGDFARLMSNALEVAGGPPQKGGDRLEGRGVAYYVESTGAANPTERVELQVSADGVTLLSGTQAMGQGLETSYAQIVASKLQLPMERVTVVQGDTARVRSGGGSGGSRSLFIGGSAALEGADALIAAGRRLAAQAMEAAEADVHYMQGRYRIQGTDRSIGLLELAARQAGERITVDTKTTVAAMSWPNGAHACDVAVDRETGEVCVKRFVAVDDVGTVINPMIVHGQVQGGIAQGLGQALLEQHVFDDASGQPLTGSFMDYAMPRADDLPALEVTTDESWPCTTNPLGAKGAGEGGAIGAAPAVYHAVLDALGLAGESGVEMPLTPEKVWRLASGLAP